MAAPAQRDAQEVDTVETVRVVVGAAAVLTLVDGGDRYLYRGAPVASGAYTPDSVAHAVAIGLVSDDLEPEAQAKK